MIGCNRINPEEASENKWNLIRTRIETPGGAWLDANLIRPVGGVLTRTVSLATLPPDNTNILRGARITSCPGWTAAWTPLSPHVVVITATATGDHWQDLDLDPSFGDVCWLHLHAAGPAGEEGQADRSHVERSLSAIGSSGRLRTWTARLLSKSSDVTSSPDASSDSTESNSSQEPMWTVSMADRVILQADGGVVAVEPVTVDLPRSANPAPGDGGHVSLMVAFRERTDTTPGPHDGGSCDAQDMLETRLFIGLAPNGVIDQSFKAEPKLVQGYLSDSAAAAESNAVGKVTYGVTEAAQLHESGSHGVGSKDKQHPQQHPQAYDNKYDFLVSSDLYRFIGLHWTWHW